MQGIVICTSLTTYTHADKGKLDAAIPIAAMAVKAYAVPDQPWLEVPNEEQPYIQPEDQPRIAWLSTIVLKEALKAIGHPLDLGQDLVCLWGDDQESLDLADAFAAAAEIMEGA